MRNFFTRYSFSYPSTLVYMMQSVEYDIPEYAKWYNRTKDFSFVAKRKQLNRTLTVKILLLIVWGMIAVAWAILGYLLLFSSISFVLWVLIALVVSMLAPWILALALVIPIFLGQLFIQKPRVAILSKRVAKILSGHPAQKIAIAGSYGKTSMKDILSSVLGEAKKVAMTPGNYNTPIGIYRFTKALDGDEQVLLLELGEYYPGDVKQLADITHPDLGVITGVTMQHMQRFKSLKAARDTIFELADYLKDKPVLVNGESRDAQDRITQKHIVYDRKGCDGWAVKNVSTSLEGTKFTATKGKKIIHAHSQLLGLHQVGPLTAAIAIAERLGLSVAQIESGIRATKPFEHRLQPLGFIPEVTVIDDAYNGNFEGFMATIDFLHSLNAKRKVYVTPGIAETGEHNREIHQKIGKQLAKQPPDVIVLMKNSSTPFIAESLEEAGFKGELIWQEDPSSFYANLQTFTVPGDVVVLQNDWGDSYI